MTLNRDNGPSMPPGARRFTLLLLLISLVTCPGCYERVVGGTGSYVQKTDVYEPNVDKDKGALEQFADDLVGSGKKKK